MDKLIMQEMDLEDELDDNEYQKFVASIELEKQLVDNLNDAVSKM